jgi:hypothetical protein
VQFTEDDLLNAVQRRQDEILSITGCTITRYVTPAFVGRITLFDSVIDIRRVSYSPQGVIVGGGYGSGIYGVGQYGVSPSYGAINPSASVLWPEDAWGEQSFAPHYLQNPPGIPLTYLQSTQPPISFDTDRAPGFSGDYILLVVLASPSFTVGAATPLMIPDDWTHVLKFGALGDLFARESNSKDMLRANYCEQRYRMGVEMLSSAPSLLQLRNNNVPMQIDAVRSGDLYNTSWEAQVVGVPNQVYSAGLNLFAISPPPDSGTYTLTATVVQNAPIPVSPASPVQLSRDDYDAVLDYCVHLAMLKAGGSDFLGTQPLFERFMKQATLYNAKLAELGEYQKRLFTLSQIEDEMNPRSAPLESVERGE